VKHITPALVLALSLILYGCARQPFRSTIDISITRDGRSFALEGAPARLVERDKAGESLRAMPIPYAATLLACNPIACWIGGRYNVAGRVTRVRTDSWRVDAEFEVNAPIQFLATSNAGTEAVAISSSGEVIEWSSETRERHIRLEPEYGEPTALHVDHDMGILIAAVTDDETSIRLIDGSAEVREICTIPRGAGKINSVGRLGNDETLFAGTDTGVLFIVKENCMNLQDIAIGDGSAITTCVPIDRDLVCGAASGGIYALNVDSLLQRVVADLRSTVSQIVFSGATRSLLVATVNGEVSSVEYR